MALVAMYGLYVDVYRVIFMTWTFFVVQRLLQSSFSQLQGDGKDLIQTFRIKPAVWFLKRCISCVDLSLRAQVFLLSVETQHWEHKAE